jgi:uncharacterized protein YcbX
VNVAWLSIAPVKGLALQHPDEIVLEKRGVLENRRFHLIGEDGRLINGKKAGTLVRVKPSYWPDREYLSLRLPDGTVAEDWVKLGEPVATNFYGHRDVPGHVVEGPWSDALSELAGFRVQLVQTDEPGAGVDRGRGKVSLLSEASLEALAQAAGTDAVDGRRFRMLVGIAGARAHEEDEWLGRRVRIGGAVVRPLGHVGRCAITSQDPETGVPNLDTLRAIRSYREEGSEPIPFGVWGDVAEPGAVRVGDAVEPLP